MIIYSLEKFTEARRPADRALAQSWKDDGFSGVLVVQNPPANVGDVRDPGWIPGSGRSPGGGRGNAFQYSCLENCMDRGAWWVTVHSVAQSWTQLKRLSIHQCTPPWVVEKTLQGDGPWGSLAVPVSLSWISRQERGCLSRLRA